MSDIQMGDNKSCNIDKNAASADGAAETTQAVQLSRLSSILNGLENGASAMRRHVQQAMRAVQSGSYKVDPMQLSRRIVGDAIGSARKLAKIGRESRSLRRAATAKPNGSVPSSSTPSEV